MQRLNNSKIKKKYEFIQLSITTSDTVNLNLSMDFRALIRHIQGCASKNAREHRQSLELPIIMYSRDEQLNSL